MSVNNSHNDTEKQGEPVSKLGSENTGEEFFINNINANGKDGEANC